jgi:heme/copper-type cytochrome/quinol oxidase subunit 4
MKKKDIYTLGMLIVLTITTAIFSTQFSELKYVVAIILGLSAIKFILVAFQFMELKKANPFWKFLVVIYLILFVTIVSVSL